MLSTVLGTNYTNSFWFLKPELRTRAFLKDDTREAIDDYIDHQNLPEVLVEPVQVTFLSERVEGTAPNDHVVSGSALVEVRRVFVSPTDITKRTYRKMSLTVDFSILPDISVEHATVNPAGLQIDRLDVSESVINPDQP